MTLKMTKNGAKMCDIITSLALVAYAVLTAFSNTQVFNISHAFITAGLAGVMLVSYMLKTFYKNNLIVDVLCISAFMMLFIYPFANILVYSVQGI